VSQTKETYITSKVLLPAQDGFIRIELTFQLGDMLLDTLFVRRQSDARLDHPFKNNDARDWRELSMFDARCLLKLRAGLGIRGD